MELPNKQPTAKGPPDWFTGDVWIDAIAQPHDDSTLNVAAVHFTPGARTAWHSLTDGTPTWGDHVTDAEYNQQPSKGTGKGR